MSRQGPQGLLDCALPGAPGRGVGCSSGPAAPALTVARGPTPTLPGTEQVLLSLNVSVSRSLSFEGADITSWLFLGESSSMPQQGARWARRRRRQPGRWWPISELEYTSVAKRRPRSARWLDGRLQAGLCLSCLISYPRRCTLRARVREQSAPEHRVFVAAPQRIRR